MELQKGQSAIEYLTTYGWMLLLVAIVGGAIFTTLQNSSQIQSVSGLNNADVQVSDYGLNEEGLQLSLRAAASDQVNINKLEITDPETGITAEISPSKVVSVGGKTQIQMKDVKTTEASDEYNLKINYDTGGLEGLTAEGKIKGSLGVFNRIKLESVKFNRSLDELQILVQNTGDNKTDSIRYTIEANNTDYKGSLSNLASGEEAQINVSTDETYALEAISLDTEGYQFLESSSGLKCTPTQGLVGYWSFNEEQAKNGETTDLSGYKNHGAINGVNNRTASVGESYFINSTEGDYIKVPSNSDISSAMNDENFTVSLDLRVEKYQSSISDEPWRDFIEFSNGEFRLEERGKGNYLHWHWRDDDSNNAEGVNHRSDNEMREFNHIAMTVSNDTAESFTNGEFINSNDIANGIHELDGKIKLGTNNVFSADELRVYNYSLPQQKIQRLSNVKSEVWAVSGCKLTG